MANRDKRSRLAVGLVAAAAVAAVTSPAGAVAEPKVPGVAVFGTVTLLTGDQVTMQGGRARVRPGQGREGVRFVQRVDERGHLHVVPGDAAGEVSAGWLDPRLFDVSELIRAGYDDLASPVTPLIVIQGGVVAGTKDVRALPSVDGVSLSADKSTAFWSGIRAAGVRQIWLDGPVRASLDKSVPQIGAPEAWQSGHTGKGTTVAVLDTGIDESHPDLAGAVVEAKNFSDAPTTDDLVGHGTHVASTITGDGQGKDGRYTGVAPDAKLLSGKVLNDFGGGRESDIIAGMEWAAAAKADIVNMSLGSGWPTDGTDPMSQALNRITADTGTLFVVSAGNSGPGEQSIGSPAAADAALTVGAVDRTDALAEFSSRGPRWIDNAIKPDITAPGVGIVAAKAKNGQIGDPVGDGHVALSGTSMAAPHVAGAAAVLAGQHPDWTADRLKAALMGSAKANPALNTYQQGAGRVDVARAVSQQVSATPATLSLGTALWPHHDDAPIVKTVTYRNSGSTPLALQVTADLRDATGKPAPAGMAGVSPSSVTVPAGGQADVTLTTKTSVDAPDGVYGGVLTATGGDTSVRTPIGVTKEVESYNVKVSVVDHNGAPTPHYFYRFVDIDKPKAYLRHDPSGTVTSRVPKGTFYFESYIQTPGEGRWRMTEFMEPAFTVTKDTELVLDARHGKPISVAVEQPNAKSGSADLFFDLKTNWGDTGHGIIADNFDRFFLVPSKTSAPGRATFSVSSKLAEPDGKGDFVGSPYQYHVSWSHDGGVPEQLDRRFADRDLAKVQTLSAAGAPGKTGFRDYLAGGPLPLRTTEYYSPNVPFYSSFVQMASPDAFPPETSQRTATPRKFKPGRTTEKWNAAVFSPAFPVGYRPYEWAGRQGDEVRVSIPMFTDQNPNRSGGSGTDTSKTTLHRDGKLIAESPYAGYLRGTLPAGKGAYTLHSEATRSGVSELSTRISAGWTFGSATVPGTEPAALPLLAVRFAPSLDENNRTAAGRPFTFPVYVQRNGSAKATGVQTPKVQVSYDDGASWKPVRLVKVGDRWFAAVAHPADAKFVSLKAQARGADGATVDQTIIRAYGLK